MKANYLKVFIFWVALGIGVSGFLFIFSDFHYKTERESYGMTVYEDATLKPEVFQIAVLITIVGAILIGGLGYAKSKESSN
jgi:hypothetical protein